MPTTAVEVKPHPAPYSPQIMVRLRELLPELVPEGAVVLDPFAGIGRIHELADLYATLGVELEPEWAAAHPQTLCGNSRDLRSLGLPTAGVDAIVTSPAYGNRLADSYDGRDGTRRYTYRISLDRPLSDDSGAAMHWREGRGGDAYRELHTAVWAEATAVLRPRGIFVLNVSNHIKGGEVQRVAEWHLATLLGMGYHLVRIDPVDTPGMRHGANGELRTEGELLIVLRRGL